MSALNRRVLVLTKGWQASSFMSVRNALHRMAKARNDGNFVIALNCDGGNYIPTPWEEWIKLEVQPGDPFISTAKLKIKVPTIVVSNRLTSVPKVEPRFSKETFWRRQNGRCMYTGTQLNWYEANIDHHIPRSKGGKSTFENCGLTSIELNQKKGDRMAEDVGLRLHRPLTKPAPFLLSLKIKASETNPEWSPFLIQRDSYPLLEEED